VHDGRERHVDLGSRDGRRKLEEQGDYKKGRANFFAVRRPEWSLPRCLGRATYGLGNVRRWGVRYNCVNDAIAP